MIEKEEMVQALVSYKEKFSYFPQNRQIILGKVAEIDNLALSKEVTPGLVTTPFLLDMYTTRCQSI